MLSNQLRRSVAILESAKPRDVVAAKCRHGVTVACWSFDGRYLATSGRDGYIQVWALEKLIASSPPRFADIEWAAHARDVVALTFKPDNHAFLASGAEDGSIKIWSMFNRDKPLPDSSVGSAVTGTGRSKELYKIKSSAYVANRLLWNPHDGNILLGVGKDDILRIFDLAKGDATHSIKDVTTAVFHSYLKCLIVGHSNGSISMLSLQWEVCHTIRDHVSTCLSLAVDPMKNFVFSTGSDGCINIYDAEYLEPIRSCKNENELLSGDGELIAGASDTNSAYIWHAGTGLVANVSQASRKIGWIHWHPQRAVLVYGYFRDDTGSFRVIAA